MKKILILLITTILLTSCFWKDDAETPEDIVSNVVEVNTETPDENNGVEVEETEEVQEEVEEPTQEETQNIPEPGESVVSGSDNDPRVSNTDGEWTNPPETQTPSVPTETPSNAEEQEIIKDFEVELDSLFDLLESDEG